MKWGGVVVLMCITFSGWCNPGLSGWPTRDSVKVAERKKAKVERERQRIMRKWDERTMQQKKTDRRVVFFLVISAGLLANSISHKE